MSQRLSLIKQAAGKDPRLVLDYARWFFSSSSLSMERHPVKGAVDHDEGLRRIRHALGPYEDGLALRELREWTRPESVDAIAEQTARDMSGDPSLGLLAYACVRALRPTVVVETGVATGVTSAYVLAGLEDNTHGELHSIDLPPTDLYVSGQVGSEVPPQLQHRWTYHWGDARRLLPKVLSAHRGQVGIFVHDSNHTYENMRSELEQALASVTNPGVVLADDVDANDAFAEATRDVESFYIRQDTKPGSTGIAFVPVRQTST
jgi:predicted O-methyltransferase YrrM